MYTTTSLHNFQLPTCQDEYIDLWTQRSMASNNTLASNITTISSYSKNNTHGVMTNVSLTMSHFQPFDRIITSWGSPNWLWARVCHSIKSIIHRQLIIWCSSMMDLGTRLLGTCSQIPILCATLCSAVLLFSLQTLHKAKIRVSTA